MFIIEEMQKYSFSLQRWSGRKANKSTKSAANAGRNEINKMESQGEARGITLTCILRMKFAMMKLEMVSDSIFTLHLWVTGLPCPTSYAWGCQCWRYHPGALQCSLKSHTSVTSSSSLKELQLGFVLSNQPETPQRKRKRKHKKPLWAELMVRALAGCCSRSGFIRTGWHFWLSGCGMMFSLSFINH